ncbi:MAG: phasin family protein [Gammaproteobacteria bacterium]|nr:phasin family protein [Gammaproteobacteria bacterium]
MQNELMQQWAGLNKKVVESMKELGDINSSVLTQLTERQMAIVNAYLKGVNKQMESLGETKDTQEIMAAQTRLAREFNEEMLKNTQQTMDLLLQSKSDLTAWVEKGMQAAAEAVKAK